MSNRRTQIVSTKRQRKTVTNWMINKAQESGSSKQIAHKAVEQFPSIFNINNEKFRQSCIKKAYRWWIKREEFLLALRSKENQLLSITSKNASEISTKRCAVKVLSGRERKRNDWVEYLHQLLYLEFEIFSSTNIKLSRGVLQYLAVLLLNENDSIYTPNDADPTSGRPISEDITLSWIDSFLSRFNIVPHKQSGSLCRSPSHTRTIEKRVAYYLGFLQRSFMANLYEKNMVENMDETHFIFNMGGSKTLGLRGSANVNYADVVGGADGLKIVLRLRGGCNAKLMNPFIIFRSRDRNYPMINLLDDIPGISYRTQPRGWVDNIAFNA